MKVWIGYFEKKNRRGVWIHATFPISDEDHLPQRSTVGVDFPNTQTTTLVIGKLYIYVLSSEIVSIVRRQNMGRGEKTLLYRIHPLKKSPLVWPPSVERSDQDADAIASAFSERGIRTAVLGS